MIYNPGESNSIVSIQLLKSKIPFGINLVEAPASRTSEVSSAAQSLVGRVDAIYVPNDNTVVSAMESVAQVSIRNSLPLFAADIGSVQQGAIAAVGYNRHALGKKAGELGVRVLRGESPEQIPVLYEHSEEVLINKKSASQMGVKLPLQLPKNVRWVGRDL